MHAKQNKTDRFESNCSNIIQIKYCSNIVQMMLELFKSCSNHVKIMFNAVDARASNDWKLFLSCLSQSDI